MEFFKYYSANPYATIEDVMAPLRYHSLRYSSPESFNDPYDCKCVFETIDSKKEDAFSKTINKHLRVACLSRNPCSPIMWAHYSTNHLGYIIHYDIQQTACKKVNYEEIEPFYYSAKEMQSIILSKYPNILDSEIDSVMKKILLSDEKYFNKLMNAIFTKHTDWQYEEEYRFIDINERDGFYGNHLDQKLNPTQVKNIILGYKFDHKKYDSTLKSIIYDVYNNNLKVYKAFPALDEYKMRFIPYEL